MSLMSYKAKFIILFVLFGTIVVTTSSIISFTGIKKNMVTDFNENVKNIASLKQNLFVKTINTKAHLIETLPKDKKILSFFKNHSQREYILHLSKTLLKADNDLYDISFFNSLGEVLETISSEREKTNQSSVAKSIFESSENLQFSSLEFHQGKYLFPIYKKIYYNKKLIGFIKARINLGGIFSLFEKTSVANLFMINQDGHFFIYNDNPNVDKMLHIEDEFPEDAEDLLFADVYVGSNLYAQKIVMANGAEYRIVLKLNTELITQKQEKVFYLNLLLVLGVIIVSIPIAYVFSIIPDKLNRQLEDLNTSLEQRVLKEVQANREKDQIMFQQSKNAAMGEMISMITHQWRQPLSSIGALASQVKLMSDLNQLEKSKIKELMSKIMDSTKYLSYTIEDFKNFFKPNKQKERISMSAIIDEVLKFSDHAISINSIGIIREEERSIEATIVKNEAIQVVMNLVKNAIDQLRNIDGNRVITTRVYKNDKKISIEIEDNGGGIPKESLENIFNEYYSTKEDGTGLGLYMSQMIVRNSFNGELTGKNSKVGAVFTISFES